jgi:glc operon protein GlcG
MKASMIIALAAAAATQTVGAAPVAQKGVLTVEGARAVLAAAESYAHEHNAPGAAVAIVDSAGGLVLLERLDGTFAASWQVSIGKARTAVAFGKPTRVFEDLVNKGRTTMVTLPELTSFTPLMGGVPLMAGNDIVGAIGVSGASSAQQDDEIAQAAADAFAKQLTASINVGRPSGPIPPPGVQYFDSKQVREAFRKGDSLVDDGAFKVNASRRDAAGEAEVHATETDIIYVLDGSATFVTGGQVIEAHNTSAHEIRGSGIEGGTERRLARGDVIVVPSGVPHWFKTVDTPLTYYVVKSVG